MTKQNENLIQESMAEIKLIVLETSKEENSPPLSESEEQPFLSHAKLPVKGLLEPKIASPPPTKVLFLDGVRGLAAILVVTQHSGEYLQDFNLGAVAVDTFFVLSSFLLTWLFMKTSIKLLAQEASLQTWIFTLADYFSKRFFRVYPLFALTVTAVSFMSSVDQKRYFLVHDTEHFDLFQVLTFEFDHRYFVLWTLPLEISYYFVIPVFVVVILGMRRFWWLAVAPLAVWVVHQGIYEYRTSHTPLKPHVATFLSGSLAAVVFVKLDAWVKKTGFKFLWWHTTLIRTVEGLVIAVLLSVSFGGLFFDWVRDNPVPKAAGFPFVSVLLTIVLVIEMIHPSCVSTMFEWSVLRYWGKISFSVYLLHSFVMWNPMISHQPKYIDRFFSRFFLVMLLATMTYYLIEYPSQLLAQRISRFIKTQETISPRPRGLLIEYTAIACSANLLFTKFKKPRVW